MCVCVCVCVCVVCVQNYQTVPETPLASCQVLKEQQEKWVDVQVCVFVCMYVWL